MIVFFCSKCGKRWEVADKYAGKHGTCKACGQRFRVPEVEATPDAVGHGASVPARTPTSDAKALNPYELSEPPRPKTGRTAWAPFGEVEQAGQSHARFHGSEAADRSEPHDDPPVSTAAALGWTSAAVAVCILGYTGVFWGQWLWYLAWGGVNERWTAWAAPLVVLLAGCLLATGWWFSVQTGSTAAWSFMRIFAGLTGAPLFVGAVMAAVYFGEAPGLGVGISGLSAAAFVALWITPSPTAFTLGGYLQRTGAQLLGVALMAWGVLVLWGPEVNSGSPSVVSSEAEYEDAMMEEPTARAHDAEPIDSSNAVTLWANGEPTRYDELGFPIDEAVGAASASYEDLVQLVERLNADPVSGFQDQIDWDANVERMQHDAPDVSPELLRQKAEDDADQLGWVVSQAAAAREFSGRAPWKLMSSYELEGDVAHGWLRLMTDEVIPSYIRVEVRGNQIIDYQILGHFYAAAAGGAKMMRREVGLVERADLGDSTLADAAWFRLAGIEREYLESDFVSPDRRREHLDEMLRLPVEIRDHPAFHALWAFAALGNPDLARAQYRRWQSQYPSNAATVAMLDLRLAVEAADHALVIRSASELETHLGDDGVLMAIAAHAANELGRSELAGELKARAERIEPDEPRVFELSLHLAVFQGDTAEAIRVLERCEVSWPVLKPAWLMSVVDSEVGRTEEFLRWHQGGGEKSGLPMR